MEVFIGNLSPNATLSDLIVFFKGFSSKAKFHIIEKRQEGGGKFRYGIAYFDSDKLALKAIKKLNQKPLRGERVVLREYFHRNYSNERRALNWREKPWHGEERRQQERRRKEIPKPAPKIIKPVEQPKQVEAEAIGETSASETPTLVTKKIVPK